MAIYLITAPSGAGKTTLAHSLQQYNLWKECISHTTRPMRAGEEDGKTYYFVSSKEFNSMYDNDEFAEKVVYGNNLYGVSKAEINRVMKLNNNVCIIVEYNGYQQIKEAYPEAIGIFLYMSKEDCLANMLLRGDKIEDAMKRIDTYDNEMKNKDEYDYVIKNVRSKEAETKNILRAIVSQHNSVSNYRKNERGLR